MSPVVLSLWPWLAAALLLGLAIGTLTGLPRSRRTLAAAGTTGFVLAGLAGIAALRMIPGRAGLWVEIGALILAAYLAGCGLGGLGRTVAGRSS